MFDRFRKKKQQPTEIEKELKIEGGLTKIAGVEALKSRLGRTDEEIDELIKGYQKRIDQLQAKQMRKKREKEHKSETEQKTEKTEESSTLTVDEKNELETLKVYLENWHMAKMVIRSATPWLRSGESKDMSKRYAAFCHFFGRNWKDPDKQSAIITQAMYLHGISHIEKDVEPPPTIWVQTPVMQGNRGYTLEDESPRNTEKISRNED